MRSFHIFLFLIVFTIPAHAARYALVIGNSSYPAKSEVNDLEPLTNPRNDATDMATLLQSVNFELVDADGNNQPLLDANKYQIDSAVDRLMARLSAEPGSDVVFYYSGHGVYLQDVVRPNESANFLLPVGVNFTKFDPVKIKGEAVSAHNIKERIESSSAQLKLMILEACRDKLTLVESHGFDTGEFKPMNPVNGMMVVHATLHSYQSWGNRKTRNSRFTGQLLAALQAGENQYIVQPLSAAIQSIQVENSQLDDKHRQYPLLEGTPFGTLCLGACGGGHTVAPVTPIVPNPAAQLQAELDLCAQHLAANRLTVGVAGNALDCYRGVLNQDRSNAQALAGIDTIVGKYVNLAEAKLRNGQREKAQMYLAKAEAIAPESPQVQSLRELIDAAAVPPPTPEPSPVSVSAELISGRYQDNGDGTVTDTTTNLMWKRCSEGQTWTGSTCDGEAITMTWNKIMSVNWFTAPTQKFWTAFAGRNDWRMPTIQELRTLVYCSSGKPKTWNDTGNYCKGEYQRPTIDQTAFPNTPAKWFWSASSPYGSNTEYAWIMDFGSGYDVGGSLAKTNRARLVCAGQRGRAGERSESRH